MTTIESGRPVVLRRGTVLTMSDAHDEAYRELQREYLDELPKMFAELRSDIDSFRQGQPVLPALRTGFHRLAGSGGSYGFPESHAASFALAGKADLLRVLGHRGRTELLGRLSGSLRRRAVHGQREHDYLLAGLRLLWGRRL